MMIALVSSFFSGIAIFVMIHIRLKNLVHQIASALAPLLIPMLLQARLTSTTLGSHLRFILLQSTPKLQTTILPPVQTSATSPLLMASSISTHPYLLSFMNLSNEGRKIVDSWMLISFLPDMDVSNAKIERSKNDLSLRRAKLYKKNLEVMFIVD